MTDMELIAALCAGVAIAGIAGTVVAFVVMLAKAPSDAMAILKASDSAGTYTRLVTILVIVAAIVALTGLDRIKGEAASAALSGIAGYVLGGARNDKRPS